MKPKHTILLVEDEQEAAETLANFLEMNGYPVITATEGNKALQIINENAKVIHLAILDIMVPGLDGHELCRHIRQHPVLKDIPVIFLTAKDREEDEIEGLELGADTYISKPASLKLVKTHVDTLLQRQQPENSNWLQFNDVYLDTGAKEVFVDEEKITLTSTEYALIELLFKNPKQVFSRQQILQHITEEDQFVFDRTVDVHVKNLRLKMGESGSAIKTYRGIGYGVNREYRLEKR